MKKKGFQVSFAWLFAIIVGAFILFLAIYGSIKLIGTGEKLTSAETGKEIGTLLNPLETGFESGKTNLLTMPVETRIHNGCDTSENFGEQIIQLSQKSLNKWTETDLNATFPNKYIFSDGIVEGKEFFLFSKPFEFPFKVADLIYLTSSEKNYCFSDAPDRIEDEISNLNQANLFTEDCPDDRINICFDGGTDCDIDVNEKMDSVKKRGEISHFETDALMYAAIFADKDVYECHVQRLMQRTEQLSLIYNDKASIISRQGCSLDVNLLTLGSVVNSVKDSEDLWVAANIVEDVKQENKRTYCRLW